MVNRSAKKTKRNALATRNSKSILLILGIMRNGCSNKIYVAVVRVWFFESRGAIKKRV